MNTKLLLCLCGGVLFSSAPALALETSQCGKAADIRSALASENQHPILTGNRSGYGYPTALVFTSNAEGTKGYLVRSDKLLGEQATTACVDAVFSDVKINTIERPGVPAWALVTSDPAAADAICKRDKLGYQEMCKPNNERLANLEGNGQRVLFAAVGTAINPRDNTLRSNQRIIVTFTSAKNGGLIMASTPEGANYVLSAYSPVNLTQYGAALRR